MNKVTLRFGPDAQVELKKISNDAEASLRPGGAFCENRDYGAKFTENVIRLAGNLHVFEGYEGTVISRQTLLAAKTIVLWYAEEFIRLFTPPDSTEELAKDMDVADSWFRNYVQTSGWTNQGCISRSYLLQYGPNSLRRRDRLQCVLERMQNQGKLRVINLPNPSGKGVKVWIQLFPTAYPCPSIFYFEGSNPAPVLPRGGNDLVWDE